MYIIDRRKNASNNNLSNRQKFIRRAKAQIKDAVKNSIQSKHIQDIKDGKIQVPVKELDEPRFSHSKEDGIREVVVNGNKKYVKGDSIEKPPGSGSGKKGKDPSKDGEGEDDFYFTLTKEEFFDFFFEDLELPDLVKKSLKEITVFKLHRAGYSTYGNPSNLDVTMSCKNALARRIALKRPKPSDIEELEKQIEEEKDDEKRGFFMTQLLKLKKKLKAVPWMDNLDIKYRNFVKHPKPVTQAVMFCIMDVSGSMGETEKDISKRFFMLLYLFLTKKYDKIDIRFISHTQDAQEVEEDEFFHSTQSGGTIVSSALELTNKIINKEYPIGDWNIYIAQCSDGDNGSDDSEKCKKLLDDTILNKAQYMAYMEIGREHTYEFEGVPHKEVYSDLWNQYKLLVTDHKHLAMKKVFSAKEIFGVFRDLFSKKLV
jgi:hypothetical protein